MKKYLDLTLIIIIFGIISIPSFLIKAYATGTLAVFYSFSFFMCRSISPLSSLILLAWVWPCACPSLSLNAVVRSIRALSRHLLLLLVHCYRDTLLALEFLVMVLAPSLPPPPTLLFRTLEGMISFPCSFSLVSIVIFPSIWLPSSLPVASSLVSFSTLWSRRYVLPSCGQCLEQKLNQRASPSKGWRCRSTYRTHPSFFKLIHD